MDIELNETQLKEMIVKMNNSQEYLALRKYYSEDSVLKILHVSREEKVHSNFVAWLLNPKASHNLDYFPLIKFLQMLALAQQKDYNKTAFFPSEFSDLFLLEDYKLCDGCEVKAEVPTGAVAGFEKSGRIDILIHLCRKGSDKIQPIIIENKVLSTENKENKSGTQMQTEKYYRWGSENYEDRTQYDDPIYVFLAPDYEQDIKCKCDKFIKISYQNVVDYVIEPCLINATNPQSQYLIENYLRCLSNATLDETNDGKESRIMAQNSKEIELLKKFHDKNRGLFDAVLAMLENDEDTTPEERKTIKAVRAATASRDYSKYSFENKEYPKTKLLLPVVKAHIAAHPDVTYAELQAAFNLKLNFNKKHIILLASSLSASEISRGMGENPITLTDGNVIVVNNQVQGVDMPEIIRIAKENGLIIEKV